MAEMMEYKCPCCGGAIAFDSGLQKLKCPYCDTEFDLETLVSYDGEVKGQPVESMTWESEPSNRWEEGEDGDLQLYVCNSCGGELVADEHTAATNCPFCNNPIIMAGRVSGVLKPDLVIPFKLDKKAAKEALKGHYKGKRLLPKVFMDENHIDEIKGVYVPFWLFDADADAHMRYRATKIRTWSDRNYDYTETRYYSLIREGGLGFSGVPVDGSSKIENDLMESIEPYDLSQAVDFQTAYLAGYLADKYDVDAQQSFRRANERIRQATEEAFASTVMGYTSAQVESSSIRLSDQSSRYALLPVWLLNTTWNGKKYTFAMNGQTGKMVGDLPMDKSLCTRWLLGLTGAVGGAIFALSTLLWLL